MVEVRLFFAVFKKFAGLLVDISCSDLGLGYLLLVPFKSSFT
jgi:hypothetical protein